ncbi:protein of unknown function [Legionella fallonii LLAP-10]|uniref:Uncharacterized protein n=1 Tax=Legionella fallonii LLAP-10 TaxID=1212491 RepID=A0A098G3V7_9GAMM|nr:protein of unknown function [Legionella fallonii LLAP-10]
MPNKIPCAGEGTFRAILLIPSPSRTLTQFNTLGRARASP